MVDSQTTSNSFKNVVAEAPSFLVSIEKGYALCVIL